MIMLLRITHVLYPIVLTHGRNGHDSGFLMHCNLITAKVQNGHVSFILLYHFVLSHNYFEQGVELFWLDHNSLCFG